MKIAIAGSGAMGSRFGKMLQDAGQSVTLIDKWVDHIARIQTNGLLVHMPNEDQLVSFKAYLPKKLPVQQFDLIILFTKAMQMESMLMDIRHVITPETKVLVLANGIGNIETIERFVPRAQIIAGVTVWSSELDGPGEITLTGSGSVSLQAVLPNVANEKFLKQLVGIMNDAHLNVSVSASVIEAIWKKAAFNCVLNTYTSLIGSNVGEFGQCTYRDQLITSALDEIAQVAQSMKVPFDKRATLDLIMSQFETGQNRAHYASMYQDLSKDRLTEIDYLNGYIAKQGQVHDIPTPINKTLTELIHCREELNAMRS